VQFSGAKGYSYPGIKYCSSDTYLLLLLHTLCVGLLDLKALIRRVPFWVNNGHIDLEAIERRKNRSGARKPKIASTSVGGPFILVLVQPLGSPIHFNRGKGHDDFISPPLIYAKGLLLLKRQDVYPKGIYTQQCCCSEELQTDGWACAQDTKMHASTHTQPL